MDIELRNLERIAKTSRNQADLERFYNALERRGVDLRPLVIRVDHDPDTDSPLDYDGWKLHVIVPSRRFHHVSPESVGFVETNKGYIPNIGLRRRFKVGLAFMVDYYEHGLCRWSLSSGFGKSGDRWDTAEGIAVLIWEQPVKNLGPKTYEARAQDAKNILETYTMWCNGETYWYDIQVGAGPDEGDDIGSCGGFIGRKAVVEAIQEELDEYWAYRPVRFVGRGGEAISWDGRTWEEGDFDEEDAE
jgi:hypothetical protein